MSDRALAVFQALTLTVSVVCVVTAGGLLALMMGACVSGVTEACAAL
ncbi:hypothetical protein SEA_MAGRITTE_142 [Microbacterium phage Magritte]|nr:hypothetical protein SEA_MAGRITTE_142 [Microbacterium phage Magritte]